MKFQLSKMKVEFGSPVKYWMKDDSHELFMNDLIGQDLTLEFTGQIKCVACGNETKKSFSQGFCYPCFLKAPENSECIIRPELCRGHEGIGRDVMWELENHVQTHVVYLALTSGVKVGITRKSNLKTRWIDQGAWKTIVLAETPNRFLCGKIELELKRHMSDKTNWQKMLKNEMDESFDLTLFKKQVISLLPNDLRVYESSIDEVLEIKYPVFNYPVKVSSESFDKTPTIKGKLVGIRGQYLIFDGGNVINIRKFSGYVVNVTFTKNQDVIPSQMSLF